MKFFIVVLVLVLVALSDSIPQDYGCVYLSGKCIYDCPEGTHAYTVFYNKPWALEKTCENPEPKEQTSPILEYSACYCDPPSVRNTITNECVPLDECPKTQLARHSDCPEGTHIYSAGYLRPWNYEPTCVDPYPETQNGITFDYSGCYCDPPTVRDITTDSCVHLDECPKPTLPKDYGCPDGTHVYSAGYLRPWNYEPTCKNPFPKLLNGTTAEYSACYCDPPTVRDTASNKCVTLEKCLK